MLVKFCYAEWHSSSRTRLQVDLMYLLIPDTGRIERANHRWTWFIMSQSQTCAASKDMLEKLSMIDESWRIVGSKRDYDARTLARTHVRTFDRRIPTSGMPPKRNSTLRNDIINISAPLCVYLHFHLSCASSSATPDLFTHRMAC